MNITVKCIPAAEHRPGITGADWWFTPEGDIEVRITTMSNWQREAILAIHEVAEAIMCKHNGVLVEDVDKFDIEYARTHKPDTDAGDEFDCPYEREHALASAVERIICCELDENWKEYDQEVGSL